MRVEAAEPGGENSQVLVGESVRLEAEGQQRAEQGVGAWLSQAQPGDAGAGLGGDRVGDGGQGGGSGDRVVSSRRTRRRRRWRRRRAREVQAGWSTVSRR